MSAAGGAGGDAVTAAMAADFTDENEWVTATVGPTGYRTEISAGRNTFLADEPIALGGTGVGPTPYELLLAALGSCMAITLRMYADRKGWPLESVSIQLRTARAHEKDCEECDVSEVGIPRIARRIALGGTLTEEQRTRLLQIADRCPVKQTLARGIIVETVAD